MSSDAYHEWTINVSMAGFGYSTLTSCNISPIASQVIKHRIKQTTPSNVDCEQRGGFVDGGEEPSDRMGDVMSAAVSLLPASYACEPRFIKDIAGVNLSNVQARDLLHYMDANGDGRVGMEETQKYHTQTHR